MEPMGQLLTSGVVGEWKERRITWLLSRHLEAPSSLVSCSEVFLEAGAVSQPANSFISMGHMRV